MIVAVTGGRGWPDAAAVVWALDRIHADTGIHLLVEGACPSGADAFARGWARANRVPNTSFHASWDVLGSLAEAERDAELLDEATPDVLVAFPGGPANIITEARKRDIRVLEYDEAESGGVRYRRLVEREGPPETITTDEFWLDDEPKRWSGYEDAEVISLWKDRDEIDVRDGFEVEPHFDSALWLPDDEPSRDEP